MLANQIRPTTLSAAIVFRVHPFFGQKAPGALVFGHFHLFRGPNMYVGCSTASDEIMQLLRMSTSKSTPRYRLDYRPQKNLKASSCLSRTGEVSAAALCTPIRCPNLAFPGQSHAHFHPSLLVKHFGAPPFWPDRSVLFYHYYY